jgi:two-component system, NarL family, nitrate/nitrite response regulator NarL
MTTARHFRLAVVDDHPVVRRGIVETLADEAGFDVVAEGASADDAVRIAEDVRPDLMLLDVSMPGGGLEAAVRIHQARPELRFAMLSIREDLATVRSALRAGARGYVSKGIDGIELVACVRRLLDGGNYVSPDLAARLLALEPESASQAGKTDKPASAAKLTDREDQIFRLLGQGLSNQEIGSKLGLTENTVKHYITPLLHKLGVRNRTEAAVLAKGGDLAPLR